VVGSKNLFTNLTQKSINESDTYFALKVPILSPKYEIMKGCPEKF